MSKEEEDLIELERYENEQRELFQKAVLEFRQSINPDYKESDFNHSTNTNIHSTSNLNNNSHKDGRKQGKRVKFKESFNSNITESDNLKEIVANNSYKDNLNNNEIKTNKNDYNQDAFLQNIGTINYLTDLVGSNKNEENLDIFNFGNFDNFNDFNKIDLNKKFELFKSELKNPSVNEKNNNYKINNDNNLHNRDSFINTSSINENNNEPDQNGIIYLPLNSEKYSCFNCYKLVVLGNTIKNQNKEKEIEENGIFCSKSCRDQFTKENIVSYINFRKIVVYVNLIS